VDTSASDDGRGQIFIVGLPRSGTTLTERILAGLDGVRSNGETDNFANALLRHAAARPGADIFAQCAAADHHLVGSAYIEAANAGTPLAAVIEKLPMNYLYLGAMARSLPKASVIWLRRHPLDACFAMYRVLFGAAYPFTYDFEDLAR
jgi:hypothetical protein